MNFAIFVQHYRTTLRLAIPVMASYAGHMLVMLSDNLMVARYDQTAFAACVFANSVFINLFVFGIGFASGLTPLVGKAFGEKDGDHIRIVFRHGLLVNTLLAILLVTLGIGLLPVLPHLGQPDQVLALSIPYFKTLVYSIIPFMIFLSFKQLAEGMKSTKPAMYFTLVSDALNIVGNYALIYGEWGFPEMGAEGAGLATFASRVFLCVSFVSYMYLSPFFRQYLQGFWGLRFQPGIFREVIQIGFPIAIQLMLEVTSFALGGIMMGWLGEVQLAAHQVAMGLASLTYMIANGIATATTIRVSNYMGERNFAHIRLSGVAGMHMTWAFMGICGLLFVVFRHELPAFYNMTGEGLRMSAALLVIAAVFQLFDATQVVMLGALRGTQDVRVPTLITLIAYWIIALPTGYVCAFKLGFAEQGIWFGYVAGLVIAAALLCWRFWLISRRLRLSSMHEVAA